MTTTTGSAAGWKKVAGQALIGFAAGAGGMFAALSVLEGGDGVDWPASAIILLGVGFVYVLMGAFVGIGTLAPRLVGQRLLNVADAEEILEERSSMGASAVGCIVLGAALMLLAYAAGSDAAGTTPTVSVAMAFWIMLAVLVLFTILSTWMWRDFDELWRQLTLEISGITGNLLMLVAAVWGGGAAAGLVPAPHPLDLVSLAFGVMLLACFVAAARRGMMTPR